LLLCFYPARRHHDAACFVQEWRPERGMMAPSAIHSLRGLVLNRLFDFKHTLGSQGQRFSNSKRGADAFHFEPNGNTFWLVFGDREIPWKHADFIMKSKLHILIFARIAKVRQNLLPATRVIVEESIVSSGGNVQR